MKVKDEAMKKLIFLASGLLIAQLLIGTMTAAAAPAAQCPSPSCGVGGYGYYPYPAYFPYQGLYSGRSSAWYYRYTYCAYTGYQPYVPAYYWWEYPYYPGCGTGWDRCTR